MSASRFNVFRNNPKNVLSKFKPNRTFDNSNVEKCTRNSSSNGFTDDPDPPSRISSDHNNHKTEETTDFFGIEEHRNDHNEPVTTPAHLLKTSYLRNKFLHDRKNQKKYEKILPCAFGEIRFDSDNLLVNVSSNFVKKSRREKRHAKNTQLQQKLSVLRHLFNEPLASMNHNDEKNNPVITPGVEKTSVAKMYSDKEFMDESFKEKSEQENILIGKHDQLHKDSTEDYFDFDAIIKDPDYFDHHSRQMSQIQNHKMDTIDDAEKDDGKKVNTSKKDETREYHSPDHISLIEEQYFGDILNVKESTGNQGESPTGKLQNLYEDRVEDIGDILNANESTGYQGEEPTLHNLYEDKIEDIEEIERQYFSNIYNLDKSPIDELADELTSLSDTCDHKENEKIPNQELSYIDENYFSSAASDLSEVVKEYIPPENVLGQYEHATIDIDICDEESSMEESEKVDEENSTFSKELRENEKLSSLTPKKLMTKLSDETLVVDGGRRERKSDPQTDSTDLDGKSAYKIAMKIREKLKTTNADSREPPIITDVDVDDNAISNRYRDLDSKGFRILKNQVPDLSRKTSFELVDSLFNGILYEHDDFLAINKPYGLASHGGSGVHSSVGQLLPKLAEKMNLNSLHLIHRLDKETTGVMLIGKNPQSAYVLHGKFVKREVIKKYVVITKGIPALNEGIIDIPIIETKIENNYRMTLKPSYTEETKLIQRRSKDNAFNALTQFRVIDSNHAASLIECCPTTGIKHQIRVHLAFGLNTPILGDHKYSHFSKTAPQRLYPETLQRLGVRQSKVRHIPMHLHASSLLLPEFLNGRNLFITAPLPKHFKKNMEKLKMSFKK